MRRPSCSMQRMVCISSRMAAIDGKAAYDVKHDVEKVTYNQTSKVLGGAITVVFYDTTTMYFESREDDVRIPGWSKDGKSANPQVVLGLLVGSGGNPIGYEIHLRISVMTTQAFRR